MVSFAIAESATSHDERQAAKNGGIDHVQPVESCGGNGKRIGDVGGIGGIGGRPCWGVAGRRLTATAGEKIKGQASGGTPPHETPGSRRGTTGASSR